MSTLRRLQLLLEYNGSRYHGWQIQPHAATIQSTLEACLTRLTNAPVRVHAAGRTDAGVHARGQVVHFDTAARLAPAVLLRGLNGLLPDDIVVRQAAEVTPDFHARYSAVRKTYVYSVHNASIPSAFQAPYAWHIPQALDVAAMRTAASALVGEHDFSAFRAASCAARTPTRHLYRLAIRHTGARLVFVLCANGFLQHMARTIVGTLIMIGRGRCSASMMATILASRQRQQAGPTAPAHGLCLLHVVYDASACLEDVSSSV